MKTDATTATVDSPVTETVNVVVESTPTVPTVNLVQTPAKTDKGKSAKKRRYNARYSTIIVKRVTLFDGKAMKRGMPPKETLKNRFVVYVPVDQDYNPEIHGVGVKFVKSKHDKNFKRVKLTELANLYNLEAPGATELFAPYFQKFEDAKNKKNGVVQPPVAPVVDVPVA
jgi:hypothetical protein